MASKLQIGIIGAGIGGLTTALTLRAAGHDVVCFERASSLTQVGAGLQVTPNAARILHRLGFAEKLAAVAVLPKTLTYRRWENSELLFSCELNPACEARYGAPFYTLHRADLHEILRGGLPSSAVRLSSTCVGVEQQGDSITVKLEDGTASTFDAVIAADGIHSRLRRTLVDDAERFSGRVAYRAVVPSSVLPREAGSEIWFGHKQGLVVYPISAGRNVTFIAVAPATFDGEDSWTTDAPVEELLSKFAGWHEDVLRTIGTAKSLLALPLLDRAPTNKWGEGRLTLLGDAAHPILPYLGQGAAQAIEDAWVLARVLRGLGPGEVVDGLRRYEHIRMERMGIIQKSTGGAGIDQQLPDGDAQRERDKKLRAMPTDVHPFNAALRWGWDAETDSLWTPAAGP